MRLNHALVGLAALVAAPACAAASDFAVIKTVPGPDGGWDYASVDSAAHRLYVAHGDAVTTVDLESLAVTPKLLAGKHLHTVLPLAEGKGLVTNGDDNTAVLFDSASGTVTATIPTGKKPDAAIFDPATGLVLVMDGAAGDITLIDPKTASSPGTIAVGGALEFAAADGHGKAYVNIEDKAEVAVIDTATRKAVARYPLPGCEEPSGLALNADGTILVSACANGKAVALNTKDGSANATLPIGARPDAVIYDAKRGLFFIPCGGSGTLSVISEKGSALSVTATVKTASGARTGALDPRTGLLYLPTADALPSANGERPKGFVPGTFRILVVGKK